MPTLLPPEHVPFAVERSDAGILISVHLNAGQHPALTQRQSSQWLHGVALPVTVDLGRIPLLNSRLIGWLFALIIDGPLTVIGIRNASAQVQAQIRRTGLTAFVAATPESGAVALPRTLM